MKQIKTVSLTLELAELLHALEAAQFIVEQLRRGDMPTEDDARRAPGAVSSILSLVQVRIRDLGRVARRRLDPADFWARHNETEARPAPFEDPDVRFKAWSPRRVKAGRRR